MHVAWTTWCAYAVWSVLRQHSPRVAWLAWVFPCLTAFVVLATGHHYVLDTLAGAALVAFTVHLTRAASSLRVTVTSGRREPRP
jgi:PAP2 superfamily